MRPFRASFLEEETPAFSDYRVTVVAAPPAKPADPPSASVEPVGLTLLVHAA